MRELGVTARQFNAVRVSLDGIPARFESGSWIERGSDLQYGVHRPSLRLEGDLVLLAPLGHEAVQARVNAFLRKYALETKP